jgi:hypothetical protein
MADAERQRWIYRERYSQKGNLITSEHFCIVSSFFFKAVCERIIIADDIGQISLSYNSRTCELLTIKMGTSEISLLHRFKKSSHKTKP